MPYTIRKRKLAKAKRAARKARGLTRKQVQSVKTIAKNQIMKVAENKVFGPDPVENEQLFHNKTFYKENLLACKQGVRDPNNLTGPDARIGDEIYLRNVNVRFWLSNKLDRPNVMYKLYLFWYDSTVTLSDAECYFTQTNKMLDRVNNENISVIDQKTIFSKEMYLNGTEKFEHSQLCTLNKSWKGKKVTYSEGGAVPKFKTLGFMVVCYDAFGTLQTDNIASMAYNIRVKFADP